jgi:hypothetical protein
MTDDGGFPHERRLTRDARPRRMPAPPDELPPSVADIKARLDRLNMTGRFSQSVDVTLLAATWATDYCSHVFPRVDHDQRMRLLLAVEAGFLASAKLNKCGIRHWERLLEEAKKARNEFDLK